MGTLQTTTLMFTVTGTPKGQPRPRFVGGRAVGVPKGSKAEPWIRAVTAAVRRLALVEWGSEHGKLAPDGMPWWVRFEAVDVEMAFTFALPVRRGKTPKGKPVAGDPHLGVPDSDNLAKLVLDVMQREGLVEDDRRCSSLRVTKRWAKQAGVSVLVSRAAQPGAVPDSRQDDEGLGSGNPLGPDRKPGWIAEMIEAQRR